MAEKQTYYATRPFFWEGKNIEVGGSVSLNALDSKWLLTRGSVTETKPTKKKAAKKK